MQDVIEWLKENGNLKIIDEPLDVELEIAHVAYLEVKKDDSRPLLFTRPINRAKNIEYEIPVLANLFANKKLTVKILGKEPDTVAKNIDSLMKFKPPKTLKDKIMMLPKMLSLKNVFPKRLSGRGKCQDVIIKKEDVDLDTLPILKTWPDDGGRFITMGQVYTISLDGSIQNLGMYRLQQYGKNRLGMHWQIHKDASSFFDEYKKAGKKMPVSVAVGGDPLYIWCGQAPMPHRMFELLLYGFIRNRPAKLVKSLTNDIYIPDDVDFVIEGFVNPEEFEIEGPFGDHTGYYTLKEPFPVMEVETITTKKNPTFVATVVGKPPLEDKYMGWATERIFLPLLKPMTPELIDYNMPENGVFHNLILAKMDVRYEGHAKQFMHAFWGVGQMSFVKHAIFVGKEAPRLDNYEELTKYILDRLDKNKILISEGVVDQLDHSSPKSLEGGKLGVDATGDEVERKIQLLEDNELLKRAKSLNPQILALKQYCTSSKNPITVMALKKGTDIKALKESLKSLRENISICIALDSKNNDLDNPYMLIWRVVNNIDAKRDVTLEPFIFIDATNKDNPKLYSREWPEDTHCDKNVLEKLKKLGLIEFDEVLNRKFGLTPFDIYESRDD
jgi:4-hydroxy-3-polyprenylbenzoate decarboxylase